MKISTRHKLWQIFYGLLIVAGFVWLGYFSNAPKSSFLVQADHVIHDLRLQYAQKPALSNKVAIVDIDDSSIADVGRWPWTRTKIATMLKNISDAGALVIALDVVFSEPEENIATRLAKVVQNDDLLQHKLKVLAPTVDADSILADEIDGLNSDLVLGYLFVNGGGQVGALPQPIVSNISNQKLLVPEFNHYISNLTKIRDSAFTSGFLSTIRDSDGVVRKVPLVLKHDGKLYASLALEAVRARLLLEPENFELSTSQIANYDHIDSVKLGNVVISTDKSGSVIVPYRGAAKTFDYVSAKDVLNKNFDPTVFKNKIVFVGATASAIGDMQATPVGAVFPGVEIHATVADALLKMFDADGDYGFPYHPNWSVGAEMFATLLIGLFLAFVMPFLRTFWLTVVAGAWVVVIVVGDIVLWQSAGFVLSIVIPLLLILSLYVFYLAYGYIFEGATKRKIKQQFGEYVPPDYVKRMVENPDKYTMDGESREMSVLFADIRSFTKLSEDLTAKQLKQVLNIYLSKMTEIIFKHHGTVDKYIGDMVIAFWGAPEDDEHHAYNAVKTALAMQEALPDINSQLAKHQLPALKIGIGVNSGVMTVGDMGSKYRKAYTVLSDAVNLGSRLESATRFYDAKIIVSEFSQTEIIAAHDDIVFERLDIVRVKGKSKAVAIYQPHLKSLITDSQLTNIDAFYNAQQGYYSQQWSAAEAQLNTLIEQDGDKLRYQNYLQRIAEFKLNDPGDDWDGVYVWQDK